MNLKNGKHSLMMEFDCKKRYLAPIFAFCSQMATLRNEYKKWRPVTLHRNLIANHDCSRTTHDGI